MMGLKTSVSPVPQAVTGLTPIPLRELDIDSGQRLSTAVKKPFGFEPAVIDFFMTQELFGFVTEISAMTRSPSQKARGIEANGYYRP
ncbi:hypothetical protein AYI77_10745 [Shewanella algae]|nr:hypothetical protein AYI77_10745 [Shewanella algae]